MESDAEVLLHEEMEIDDDYARALIQGVLSDGITDSDDENMSQVTQKKRKKKLKEEGIVAKISKTGKRPDFELSDIMGKFDIDDSGNYIILRGDDAKLFDKDGREVNRRGYLIDILGNIINRKNELIFHAGELDSDEEIPAPIGFDKRKQILLGLKDEEDIEGVLDTITKEMVPLPYNELKTLDQMNRSQ